MRILGLHGLPPPETGDALETYLADLKRATDDVQAFNADWEREPWTRIHVALVRSGLWARLKPCSRSVYMVLAALADRRKRVTTTGVEKVAKLSGLSVARTMFAYRELRDSGLIWRRRIRLGKSQPYMTGLTSPRRWAKTA
jgi:hypothetical protein